MPVLNGQPRATAASPTHLEGNRVGGVSNPAALSIAGLIADPAYSADAADASTRLVHLPALWLDFFDTSIVRPSTTPSDTHRGMPLISTDAVDLLDGEGALQGLASLNESVVVGLPHKSPPAARTRRSAAGETFTKAVMERRSAAEEELDSPAQIRFSGRGQPQLALEATGFTDFAKSLKDSMNGAFLQREPSRLVPENSQKASRRGSTKLLRAHQAYSSGKSSLHHAHSARTERVAFYRIKLKSGHEEGAYGASLPSASLPTLEETSNPPSHSIFHGEAREACENLVQALLMREKWQQDMHSHHRFPEELDAAVSHGLDQSASAKFMSDAGCAPQNCNIPGMTFEFREGVCCVFLDGQAIDDYAPLALSEFSEDFRFLRRVMANGPTKTFTYTRLKVLEHKFDMHQRMNRELERSATVDDPQDFTTVHKVDTHVHLAAGMTASHMLDFVKRTLVSHGQDVVSRIVKRDEQTGIEQTEEKTLADVFDDLATTGTALSVNALDVEADEAFMRFDIFNKKYNIFGQSGLRTLFLKTENAVNGLYFARLTKELLTEVRQRKIETEYRLSIYGRSKDEWGKLASWVIDNDLISSHNRYLIQLPRLYSVWRAQHAVRNFQDLLENIFLPLFEVTRDPASNPVLHRFLEECSGFDSVDDESKLEIKLFPATGEAQPVLSPDSWDGEHDPPFSYYMYYTYANLFVLNQLRKSRGFNTFDFRPHAGESGDTDHLASTFLLARGVNHGINLDFDTVLQYLYYLAQIGLAVSPLSNNSLFLDYKRNPFPKFFRRGLNVSLSTDDPLQFHITDVPLLEEYSIAAKRWNFSDIDASEYARNSVLQSGFSHETKKRWLGERYVLPGVAGNDCRFSNLPDIRAAYRFENLQAELAYITACMAHLNDDVPTRVDIVSPFDFWSRDVVTRGLPAISTNSFAGQTTTASHADLRSGHLLTSANEARAKYIRYLRGHHGGGDGGIDASAYSTEIKHECRAQDGVFHVFLNERSMCQHCTDTPAALSCEKCHLRYCDDCDRVLHRRPMYRSHARRRVRPGEPLFQLPTVEEFRNDFNSLDQLVHNSDIAATCSMRLRLNQSRYVFNGLLNARLEKEAMKLAQKGARSVDAVDFYQVIKVDNHVHASSFPSASHFCEFVRSKIANEPDEIVWRGSQDESTFVTLAESFERLNVDREHITVDSMNIRADRSNTFRNFGAMVNSKYTPFGNAEFGQIFLKRENAVNGRYFAELLAEAMQKSARLRTTRTELRISIHGHTRGEWAELASWLMHYQLLQIHTKRNDRERPQPVNRFVVQIPRNYSVWKRFGRVISFQDMLDNVFGPLFEAVQNPVNNDLTAVLQAISGFDSVDDESDTREYWPEDLPPPAEWTSDENPPYSYYMYYMWANIAQLNAFRRMKGSDSGDVQPYSFRPHAGADGSPSHLSATFLAADSINHGLKLGSNPTLQYLYFVNQIGITMSPLAEDSVYMHYKDNPFKDLFERGLQVSLSSDNPMQTHSTDDPLLEEYSIAAKMWKFTNTDLSEIARNSVLISGFSHRDKRLWLGPKFEQPGINGNDPAKTNVPQLRVHFRQQVLEEERQWLRRLNEAYDKIEPAGDNKVTEFHRHATAQARYSGTNAKTVTENEHGPSSADSLPVAGVLRSSQTVSVVIAATAGFLVAYFTMRWRPTLQQ